VPAILRRADPNPRRLLLHSGERIKSVRHLDILDLLEDRLAIHAEGLIKRFGSTVALNGLDLQVQAGSIFAVLGPNGAGKTTAVRIFTTLLKPDVGRVWWRASMSSGTRIG
jgi:ABC-type polysaccharide/polyol phosphate transport system ATPase subunit